MNYSKKILLTLVRRGLQKRCPQCGETPLFEGWYTLREQCHHCGLNVDDAVGNTWAFMYLSTAFLTGTIVVVMLLTAPASMLTAQGLVFVLAIIVIVGSLPRRKGLAIAMEYWVELRWGNQPHLRFMSTPDHSPIHRDE